MRLVIISDSSVLQYAYTAASVSVESARRREPQHLLPRLLSAIVVKT